MDLRCGFHKGAKGVSIEGEADGRAFFSIEGDRIGQQSKGLVELTSPQAQVSQRCCGTRQSGHITELPLEIECRRQALPGHLQFPPL
jgi:hypothetical protein